MSESHRTRRSLFQTGLAAGAGAFLLPAGLSAAEGEDEGHFQPYDQVEPENYPWGWIRWLMNGQIDPHAEMTVGIVEVAPHQTNTRHVHPNSAEFLHVISGSCEHALGARWIALKAGDTLRIPAGVPHQAHTGEQPCRSLILYNTPRRIMLPVTDPKPR